MTSIINSSVQSAGKTTVKSTMTLSMPKLPKMMSLLRHSNQFLKIFSMTLLVINLAMAVAVVSLFNREPIVVTLAAGGAPLLMAKDINAEDHVRYAIQQYLSARYSWAPNNVKDQLRQAKAFIMPKSEKAFESASQTIQKFSAERSVTQKIYPNKIEINLSNSTAMIRGDRVTSIQGLKAAGDLKLEVTFESGPRTKENPWGIYITKEKEE
jgi:hypothetical protein